MPFANRYFTKYNHFRAKFALEKQINANKEFGFSANNIPSQDKSMIVQTNLNTQQEISTKLQNTEESTDELVNLNIPE